MPIKRLRKDLLENAVGEADKRPSKAAFDAASVALQEAVLAKGSLEQALAAYLFETIVQVL